MKPDVDRLLEVAAGQLMTKLGPALPTSFEQATGMSLGVLLLSVREEMERGAQRRVEENGVLRALFAQAAPAVPDAALRERLESAARNEDPSLAISDLESANAALRGLLIELHACVEELDSPEASRIEEAIWSELVVSTERRKLAFAFF